jgi:hypothetical protein
LKAVDGQVGGSGTKSVASAALERDLVPIFRAKIAVAVSKLGAEVAVEHPLLASGTRIEGSVELFLR